MKEIRAIIDLYDQLREERVASALAVVVNVEQSSYRRIGARLLVAEDGRYVGGISGGCLEGDALKRAKLAIHRGEPAVHVYDTTDGEDEVIGVGLGCEGRIEVAFLPLDYHAANNEVELLRSLITTRVPVVLSRVLSLGGRAVATQAVRRAEPEAGDLPSGGSRVIELDGQRLLREILQPTIHLVVTGTNYDIPAALAAVAPLGWQTTVVGAKRKMGYAILEQATRVLDYSEVDQVAIDAATAVVLMSHDYDWDRRMVQHFLPHAPKYFGMLGPRKRMLKMDASLVGVNLREYPNLYSPVGLDIGAETPDEIAASLVAEIIAVFRGRGGGVLRERVGGIHV